MKGMIRVHTTSNLKGLLRNEGLKTLACMNSRAHILSKFISQYQLTAYASSGLVRYAIYTFKKLRTTKRLAHRCMDMN